MNIHRILLLSGFIALTGVFLSCNQEIVQIDEFGQPNSGTNSSYARMLTVGEYLYAVNVNELITFDATNPSNPVELNRQTIGEDIETIFHYEGSLLIGSGQGTLIYTIDATGIPRQRGQFDYSMLNLNVLPCDPVVAADDVAYATLYTFSPGTGPCGRDQIVNQLVVMNIQDLENPSLITNFDVASPRGLAVRGSLLFLCNEFEGLTVYDVSDPANITELSRVLNVTAYDVLAKEDELIVVGREELVQFDYSNPSNLVRLGSIDL